MCVCQWVCVSVRVKGGVGTQQILVDMCRTFYNPFPVKDAASRDMLCIKNIILAPTVDDDNFTKRCFHLKHMFMCCAMSTTPCLRHNERLAYFLAST